jgi:hypothetical protein
MIQRNEWLLRWWNLTLGQYSKEVARSFELGAFNFLNLLYPILAQNFKFKNLQAQSENQVWFHVHIKYFQML